MTHLFKYFCSLLLIFSACSSYAQEGTRNSNEKKELTGKILIIPYESKMYMSDVDQKINQVTKWKSAQINEYFRRQLDAQLKLKFQSVLSPVLTFYTDSAKTAKDLDYVYKSTAISFDKVDKPTAPTVANVKKDQGIKNGQLAVEISADKKFSNVKFTTNELIPYLAKKYQSEYIVFINELDMLMLAESYDLATDSYMREVTVHYTIVDKNSKLIAAGAAVSKLSSKVNEPKKIASQAFSPIATYMATRFSMVIKPTGK